MPEQQRGRPIVGGNWKMNTNQATASTLAKGILQSCASLAQSVDVVLFPPFPYLLQVARIIGSGPIQLGAQDVYSAPDGAFTGEVSTTMIKDCGCSWVLTGHSERRHVIGETDETVNTKTLAALAANLNVILCIGETLQQREKGETDAVNRRQLLGGLKGVSGEQMTRIVIAYEPVWAIGTGRNATPEDAQQAHVQIRRTVTEQYGEDISHKIRIQYGGSMKPANAGSLLAQPDIDGGLIGGASLNPADFAAIVESAKNKND